ncbi:hypothetical protein Cgig2_013686 [Carnegiea gigantea]|uniref:Uncharacterized protein n=1 Tax=Carnegiea gigantea TaxID=171969 RepID=A0A9Q1QH29_9CARY|nr:hypothetical protein Cgig2_013686 [Carnegiea gigantea]
MGRDGLQIGVQVRTCVIIMIRICYRSICSHPFLVGILLFMLFLCRSSPFLFSLLASSSPVLVCTAVLLGTLLSFGEPKFPLVEEDEKTSAEVEELKTGSVNNTICIEKDESIDRDTGYAELRREIVEETIDERPLLVSTDRVERFETDPVARSLMPIEQNCWEIQIGKQPIDEVNSGFRNLETEQKASLDDQKIQLEVDAGLSHDEILENGLSGKSQAENFEDYKSAEESVDTQVRDQLDSSTASWERPDSILEDILSPVQKVDASSDHDEFLQNSAFVMVQAQNFEDYKSAEGSIDAQIRDQLDTLRLWEQSDDVLEDSLSPVRKVQAAVFAQLRNQLESSLGSWNCFDVVVENRSSAAQKVQAENSEDYKSAEGSVDAQRMDQLGSSFEAWKHFGSDHDDNDGDDDVDGYDEESNSGSDGAESYSPDASMADIIPMLDELHPLLEDENPQTGNLSRQISAITMVGPGKSCDSSIHSDDESDHEEEVGDIKSDAEGEHDEEETQGSKDNSEKSAIMWTEDDQKNLMDLGSSELERNQRLESLIARRRARRMMAERNLMDLDGMDLQFQVAPISTTRCNPFDLPHDLYDDLGLPPVPGSAPSVLLPRRNPFDLPYDSSEEKPDLMADSFQQEFMELYQGEASNQREAVFRRNETFNLGSSIFSFGRHEGRDTSRISRFRPYFVPERTDSDVMSYSSSLQRQTSELSEFKASSAAETESTLVDGDEEETGEHESAQEMEPSSEIDRASVLVKLGSQSSDDLHSLSDKEKDFVLHVPEIELGGVGNCRAAVSGTFETHLLAEIGFGDRENDREAESWMLDREISVDVVQEPIKEEHDTDSRSSSSPKEYNDVKVEDVNEALVNGEHSQVDNVDMLVRHSLETSGSDVRSDHSPEASNFSPGTEVGGDHPKEPVYDSSPQAVKMNNFSPTISLDMHIERSEIRLYQMPSVRRDFVVPEEPKVYEEDAEQCIWDGKQDVDDLDITMKENEEVGHGISDQSQFSEGPINVEALVASEHELRLSADSSDTGLVKLSDDKVSEDERMQVLNQEDDFGVYMEGKLDTIEDEDDKASAICDGSSEDLTLTPEKRDTFILRYSGSPVQSEICYLTVEITEEARMDKEAEQQCLTSSANLMNDDNDMIEKLASALDESHPFPHESSIEDPSDSPGEKKSSIAHGEVEEVGQENNVDRHLNIVGVEEYKENIFPDLLQSDQPSSGPEEFENESVAELAEKEHVNNNISQELGVSGGDEKIVYDLSGNMKEMNEELLSELDAVGDFSVKDIALIMDMSLTYSNARFDSTMYEQVQGERHSDTGTSFVHGICLEANATLQQDVVPLTEGRELNAAACEELNLDSLAEDASTRLLVLEALSVVDIDAAFKRMSKGDVQKPVTAESIAPDLMRELPEASCPETELVLEDIEPGTNATQVMSPQVSAPVDHSEPVDTIASDLSSVEGHTLDYSNVDSRISFLDAEISEKDDEDFEKTVESETDSVRTGEASRRAPEAETGVGSVEPAPLEINRDVKEMPELWVVEARIASVIASTVQIETFSSIESKSSQTDSIIKEIQDLSPAETSVAPSADSEDPIERVSSVGSSSLLIERVGSVESPVVEATSVTSFDNEDEVGRVGLVESPAVEASSVTLVDNEGKIERVRSVRFPVVEASSITSIDNEGEREAVDFVELPAFELRANIIPSKDSEERIGLGFVESRSSIIEEDIKETKEPPADEEVIACAFASEAQLDKVGYVEAQSSSLDGDIKEMQELPVVGEILPSAEAEDQTQRFGLMESESVHIGREGKEVQELHDDKTSRPSAEVGREDFVEVESLPIDGHSEAIQESPIVEPNMSSSGPFEHETETAGAVESELLQIEADIKSMRESPVVEAHIAFAIESEDQTEGPSPMDIVGSLAPQDHELTSLQQSDGPLSGADDSATLTGGVTSGEFGGTERPSSQSSGGCTP